jgi:hypothetical protein
MNLPRSAAIRNAFEATRREIKMSLKEINARAGKFMARGNYARAQQTMELAKQVQQFLDELRAFQKRLKQVRTGGTGTGPKPPRDETHALWEYYQPILQCLVDLNGEAKRDTLEKAFEQRYHSWLKPGDKTLLPRGEPRWKLMFRQTKKCLIGEGFVEAPNHLTWRITPAGRKAAQQEPSAPDAR